MAAKSIGEIMRANRRADHFFFEPEAVAHWGTVVYPATFDAGDEVTLFITSETTGDAPRRYAVRVSQGSGRVIDLTRMGALRTYDMAVTIAATVAHWWLTDTGPGADQVDDWVARAIDSDQ